MIKRKGQRIEGIKPHGLKRMSEAEYAAYCEAVGAIKSDYQALCLVSDKLREVETAARSLGPLDSQTHDSNPELLDMADGRSPWEPCTSLMRLNQNEVLLCKRICEHGLEYAVIDHSPAGSSYARSRGPADILHTGDNPRQVLREYLRSEREALQLMVNDMTANVRLLVAERFPHQDLRRVVNEIASMCKKVARLGFSESLGEDLGAVSHKLQRGVRV
ncbi:MAG TPA: hypothetical protein VL171_10700 [Verrucomicrobiae bacterium]|nr:hypothetical protein [Verrucomicrobiae bacterium]